MKSEYELNNSVEYLKQKKVTNIKYKINRLMNNYLIGSKRLKTDILETLSYLKSQKYYTKHFHVTQQSTEGTIDGIVFINFQHWNLTEPKAKNKFPIIKRVNSYNLALLERSFLQCFAISFVMYFDCHVHFLPSSPIN